MMRKIFVFSRDALRKAGFFFESIDDGILMEENDEYITFYEKVAKEIAHLYDVSYERREQRDLL